jgi:hypothetical protein
MWSTRGVQRSERGRLINGRMAGMERRWADYAVSGGRGEKKTIAEPVSADVHVPSRVLI